MYKRQRGVTFLGWIFLLLPLAMLVYTAIRVTPIYLNYFRVARSLEQVANENAGGGPAVPGAVRNALDKRFDIEEIRTLTAKDIDVHRNGDRWMAIADYEDTAPLFGDVSILVKFHKEVELKQ